MVKITMRAQFPRIRGVEGDLPVGFYYGQVRGFALTNPQLFLATKHGLVFFNGNTSSDAGESRLEAVDVIPVDVELIVTEGK